MPKSKGECPPRSQLISPQKGGTRLDHPTPTPTPPGNLPPPVIHSVEVAAAPQHTHRQLVAEEADRLLHGEVGLDQRGEQPGVLQAGPLRAAARGDADAEAVQEAAVVPGSGARGRGGRGGAQQTGAQQRGEELARNGRKSHSRHRKLSKSLDFVPF